MEIQHFSHHHPLILRSVHPRQIYGIKCSACSRSCLDLIYSCRECEDFHLHKSCAELPPKITHHPFHPFHPLPLVLNSPRYACCGCGKWDSGLLYLCKDCNFTLSPDCAVKPTTRYEFVGPGKIQHFLHKHPLALVEEDDNVLCLACEKYCPSESYSCHHCPSFKIHRTCAEQLPRAIQHFSHPLHPLILRAKDSRFDQPCVACYRSDNVLTYRCSMCRIEMDPKCALVPTQYLQLGN
ncbi:protein VACUOLELESS GAMETOPHYTES-like [Syzygium oleosum]|uniref:protein VACUOLELESS GAMETOPHYTES-like n=1 Tax=Syzygium oleosum TaxID=219896 RepID=UPI0024B933CC|nr:protein VACUOLELESS GAMETOPHYTES-like [Syzygium oleosum]